MSQVEGTRGTAECAQGHTWPATLTFTKSMEVVPRSCEVCKGLSIAFQASHAAQATSATANAAKTEEKEKDPLPEGAREAAATASFVASLPATTKSPPIEVRVVMPPQKSSWIRTALLIAALLVMASAVCTSAVVNYATAVVARGGQK